MENVLDKLLPSKLDIQMNIGKKKRQMINVKGGK